MIHFPATSEEELFYGSRNTPPMHKFTPSPFDGRCIDCGEPEDDAAHFTAEDAAEQAINAQEEDR